MQRNALLERTHAEPQRARNVAAFLTTTPQLRREEDHYTPWMSLCDDEGA
jgi:hypothetical protein